MKISDLPTLSGTPFAANGSRTAISQNTTPGSNAASYTEGFPAITMTDLADGGLPPRGTDFNQILYELARSAQWSGTGSLYKFSQSFATAIGGYPLGSKVSSDDGLMIYTSMVDDNANNPNSDATGWYPDYLGGAYLLRNQIASSSGSSMVGLAGGGTLADATNNVYPESYGSSYDENRLQLAINAAVSSGKVLICRGLSFTINAMVTIPTTLNADFTGTIITAGSGISSGNAILIDGMASVAAGQYAGTINNFTLLRPFVSGHQDTSSNVDGISFGGSSGQASDMRWYNLMVFGFRDNVRFDGPNTYLNHFFAPRIGFFWRRGVAVYASSNSNENYGFNGGSIFNGNNTTFDGYGVYTDPGASDCEVYLDKTSIDYCDVSARISVGRLNLDTCHLENNNNNPHIILDYTSGKERPTVVATGGVMAGGPGITSWTGIPVEKSGGRDSLVYAYNKGSVFVHLYGTKTGDYEAGVVRNTQILKVQDNNSDVIADFVCKPLIDAGNTSSASRPLRICNAINAIVVNAFNLNAWTQTVSRDDGTITFSTDTTTYYSSESPSSRKYVGTAGFSTGIYQDINLLANGGKININMFVNVPSMTAGYVALRCDYMDAKGNVILNDLKDITATTSGWVQLWVFRKIPNGAVKVRIQQYYSSFTGTAYFSNENVWIG